MGVLVWESYKTPFPHSLSTPHPRARDKHMHLWRQKCPQKTECGHDLAPICLHSEKQVAHPWSLKCGCGQRSHCKNSNLFHNRSSRYVIRLLCTLLTKIFGFFHFLLLLVLQTHISLKRVSWTFILIQVFLKEEPNYGFCNCYTCTSSWKMTRLHGCK